MTKAACDAIALDEAWNAVGTRRPKTIALSADDERTLSSDWQKVGHEKSERAVAKKSPPDPYAGMTDEQRIEAKQREAQAQREAEQRAKAFSDRIDREVDAMCAEVVARRGRYVR
jgi:hypothetical protein